MSGRCCTSHGSRQRWVFMRSVCTSDTDSRPPPTTTVMPSAMIWRAAMAMAIRPEAHWRSTLMAATEVGRPARRALWRAMFMWVVPCCRAAPRMTSSTSAGSTRARSRAWRMAWPPSAGASRSLKAPR